MMKDLQGIDRRLFLSQLCAAAATMAFISSDLKAKGRSPVIREDAPNTHNMLVFGEKKIYASHLPMFDGLKSTKTDYTSPHRYQVILDISFLRSAQNVQTIYTDDRRKNAGIRIYTLNPDEFVLSKLASDNPQSPRLTGFKANVFRGHLEKGGQVIRGLNDVDVKVNRIIHFRKFNPPVSQPAELKYLLFGSAQELFLAHYITRPPDFDQVLSVNVNGHSFTDAELSKGIEITIPDRPNQASKRIKEAQQVAGQIQTADPKRPLAITLKVNKEIYFEEGELLMPPTFDDTETEKAKA